MALTLRVFSHTTFRLISQMERARVLNFEPFSHGADPPEPTDLLFVLTPHSDFRRLEMHALAGELVAGESLGVWAAVLGPGGGFSPFTTDALLLERELKEAAIQTR